MAADMKFEESCLTGFLVKNLKPLTEADPAILAEYVTALLRKEKSTNELQKLCTENLVEFLGNDTKSFIEKLFQALEDGSLATSSTGPDLTSEIQHLHPMAFSTSAHVIENSSSPKEQKDSSPSGRLTDSEDKEASEEDDDDRNHKHRRPESRPFSLDKDAQETKFKGPNRKRKPFDSGQMFPDTGSQFHNVPNNPSFSENGKFEKRRTGFAAVPRAPQDFNQKPRGSQAFNGPRFDPGRLSIGRGRGRTGSWSQQGSRFGSVDALDYASQMAHLGPTASLFGTTAQSPSWGPFGLIHGVPNSGLDTLHPLGLQGTLQPQINPSLSIGIPRQRCRDFEERGFCLRGDMCPMEHGVNRIVVEDVQSLSQFNLPVSLPSARVVAVQSGTGPLPPASTASSSLANTKVLQSRNNKAGAVDDGISILNRVFSGSAAGGDSDLYDPDQPLWSNKPLETSSSLIGHQSPKIDYNDHVWNTVSSDNNNDGGRSSKGGTMSHGTSSSIQDRSRSSQNKLEKKVPAGLIGNPENETSEYHICRVKDPDDITPPRNQIEEVGPIASTFTSSQGPQAGSVHGKVGKGAHGKASRTLYVSGIPSENNKRVALFSHFQKFGLVLDIYIPQNSNKAFVQFATREEAEAALKAPDAVMGNRFIKLWWANRDNIPDEVVNGTSVLARSLQPVSAASISPKPTGVATCASSSQTGLSHKISVESGPKVTLPSQKQMETFELMRKKQELLEQKRNALQRQLDNFGKQATVKGDAGSELAVKRLKVDTVACNAKATSCAGNLKIVTRECKPEAEKILDGRCCSGDTMVSPASSKAGSVMQLQSPKSLKQPNRFPMSSFPVNRFKLDNRPTAFGVLPPLPPELANVVVLKEHFSSFGEFTSVELEDPEAADTGPSDSKPSHIYAARVAFATRPSAERAFLSGRCLRGHSLNFAWLMPSTIVRNSHNGCNENSINATNIVKPTVEVETRTVGSSSSSTGKSSNSVIPNGTGTEGRKSQLEITESTSGGLKSKDEDLDEASSSCNKQALKTDVGLAH